MHANSGEQGENVYLVAENPAFCRMIDLVRLTWRSVSPRPRPSRHFPRSQCDADDDVDAGQGQDVVDTVAGPSLSAVSISTS